jgi:hypothetical protein
VRTTRHAGLTKWNSFGQRNVWAESVVIESRKEDEFPIKNSWILCSLAGRNKFQNFALPSRLLKLDITSGQPPAPFEQRILPAKVLY